MDDSIPITTAEFGDWLRNSPDSPFKRSWLKPIGRIWRVDGIRIFGARTSPYHPDQKRYVAFEGKKVVGNLSVNIYNREYYAKATAYGQPVKFRPTPMTGSSEKPLTTFRKALRDCKPPDGKPATPQIKPSAK